jgi:hypothetical protein
MEVEGQMDARVVLAVVGHEPVYRQVELADQEPVAVLFEHAAHLADGLVYLGPVGGVDREQSIVR